MVYRAWRDCYWNQNNRLLYWPLVATGDEDLLKPWFGMYSADLAFEKARNEVYYHQAGASYPETMYFWGLPSVHDFGWNNSTNQIESRWQRYHTQGSLEVISQMLDVYEDTGNLAFAKSSIVPLADAVVTYYDQHWPRGADGKIRMSPAAAGFTPVRFDIAAKDVVEQDSARAASASDGKDWGERQDVAKWSGRPQRQANSATRTGVGSDEEHGKPGAVRNLPLPPLWGWKAGAEVGVPYLSCAAISAGHLLGAGRNRGCGARPDRGRPACSCG